MGPYFLNISNWIEENKKYFLPPVCNKMMHGEGQLKIFYVGGPNLRKDFHLEEGEELFYMVKGDMNLIILEKTKFKTIQIKEGEVFLLPGRIPHSPQRYEDTVGLVIERERIKEKEKDCLRYFVENSTQALFEKWFYCEDLGTQLPPVIREFFNSEQNKTGKPIPDEITANPPFVPDSNRETEKPFLLSKWIDTRRKQIETEGSKRLFDESYQSDIFVLGETKFPAWEKRDTETWLWQIEGESIVETGDEKLTLKPNDSYLVASNVPYKHSRSHGSIAISVVMDPKRNGKLGKVC